MFLQNYRLYSSGSEAHPTYHTFSALVALSSIISRRIWIDMGHFKVYPNLYVILVGPPGNRKTSAMTFAKKLLRELNLPFSAECVTKEKLVVDISEQEKTMADLPDVFKDQKVYTPMTVMVTELSELLGAGGVGMINFLTTIYDQDFYELRTKNKGSVNIAGPYLTLLACTTPDWITQYLRSDVISGGFSRRAIFVLETGKAGRIAFPTVTPEMSQGWSALVDYSRKLLQLKGPVVWHPDARRYFEQWYNGLVMPSDPMVIGYYETKHMQLLKIAMLLLVSDSTELVLQVRHLEFGLELLRLAEENLTKVFSGIGRNELNATAAKVIEVLNLAPVVSIRLPGDREIKGHVMPEKKLKSVLFHSATELEMVQILQHLIDADKIERLSTQGENARSYIRLK
jgi:hypothetical protein